MGVKGGHGAGWIADWGLMPAVVLATPMAAPMAAASADVATDRLAWQGPGVGGLRWAGGCG